MSGNDRCKMYKETQSSIKKLLAKGLTLDRNIYMNQIVLIKSDVTSNDENVSKTALEMLNFLLELNIEEIEVELIRIMHETAVNKVIQNVILESVKQKVVDTILENKYSFINILAPWRNQNINKLINIVDVCVGDLPKDKCEKFFINTIIATMMAPNTDNQIRDALIDISFMMSTILPISDLNKNELDSFLKAVNTKYVINIGDLRDKDYSNWHNLWIFLVRFCDKHIHYSMDLTNRLLRVVEFAFRNSSVQQRLKGYDCWRELIDNASLDMNHMCSAKQIKLLITPLKAKFSKQEIVICKRFDIFTYLLEKLQHKSVLCLTEFLEFCFGSVGENKDPSKTGQGKSVPQIWSKSTKVLMEIIGHSHGKTVSCLSTEDIIKLENPVINHSNILNYYKVIINSVGECCSLLKDIDIESKRETAIKCLWKSVFNLVIPARDGNRKKYFASISEILDNYITHSRENPYFGDLLIMIFTVLMSYNEEVVSEIIEYILKQLLTIFFTVDDFPLNVVEKFKTTLTHWFSKILLVEIKLHALKEIATTFARVKPTQENVGHVGKLWLCVANEFIMDLTLEQLDNFENFNNFFMWPTFHLHRLDDVTKKQIVIHWMKLFRKLAADRENKKLIILSDLQKVFKSNPLLNPNIVSLINVMSQFETKFAKEFVNNLMAVSSQMLQLPNLKHEEEQKISALVMQYFEPQLECYKYDANDELIKNICTCVEHILCIHKNYKLLDTLTIFMKNCSLLLRSKFSKHLSNVILDLFNKESDTSSYNAKELQKALQVLNVENIKKDDSASPFIPPGGRSARIASMAKNSPRSPNRKGKCVGPEPSPTALRLFGKDLDTLSPLQVKGSQLKNVTPKSRKLVNSPKTTPQRSFPINDEKSSDFVPINTEVKLQPEKLSKHQKEVLRRRREDIPALYQDLSQSLSQDMFSSSSSSKGLEKTDQENYDKQKVVVEIVGDQFTAVAPARVEQKEIVFQALPEIIAEESPFVNNVPKELSPNTVVKSEVIPEIQEQTKSYSPDAGARFEAVPPSEVIMEEPLETIAEVIAPGNDKTTENLFSEAIASEGNKEIDAEETMIDEEKVASSQVENKIDEVITSQDKNVIVSSQKPEKCIEEDAYPVDVVEEKESAKLEAEEKERRRKQKIEFELQKLKMDIVGADEFLAASRRTRTREKPKKLDDFPTKKTKTAKEEKVSPNRQHISRKSLNTEVSESKDGSAIEKNRRKTIGSILEAKSIIDDDPKTSPVEDKFNKPKDPEIPKSRGRKPAKSKLDKSKVKSGVINLKQTVTDNNFNDKVQPRKVFETDETTENKEIERGDKRKRSSGDEESEDIIESSQEFHAELTPVFNSSKRRSLIEITCLEKLNKSEEKTLVQQKTVTTENFIPKTGNEINEAGVVVVSNEQEIKPVESTLPDLVGQEIKENRHDVNTNLLDAEVQVEANTSQDTTVTQESTQEDMTQIDDVFEELEIQTDTQPTITQDTQTQDTPTQDTELSVASEDIRPPILYFDLPKKPELTESERMMCRMDTMSICMDPKNVPLNFQLEGEVEAVEELEIRSESPTDLEKQQRLTMEMEDVLGTPKSKMGDSIPSSPVTVETPSRTSELLSNTLDISPINSKSSSDDGECEDHKVPTSIDFQVQMEELDEEIIDLMLEKKSLREDCRRFYDEEQCANLNEIEMPILQEVNLIQPNLNEIEMPILQEDNLIQPNLKEIEMPILQEDNLIQPEENQADGVPHQHGRILEREEESIDMIFTEEQNEHGFLGIENTPNQQETEVISNNKIDISDVCSEKISKESNIQERASRLLNMVNVSSPVTHKIFAKKRSLTMSPSTARIKKLMSNFNQKPSCEEEVIRNVKEEDLLTFSREVPSPLAVPRSSILKRKVSDSSESDGISPCPKRKRVNFSDPCLTSKKLFIKDDYNRESEANCDSEESIEVKTEEELSARVSSSSDESSGSERLTGTENVETEPSLEMINPLMLKKDKPIYPRLVDCKENVILILKRVTSPMFITTLMNKLKNKQIKTIGDLAKQSESEINRFPFKVPVVPNVYKALDSYYKKNVDKYTTDGTENGDVPKVNGVEENKRQGVIKKTSPKKVVDIRVEFKQLIEKMKTEGTIQELLKLLVPLIEKRRLLGVIKTHYNLEFSDFLSERDFKVVIKHITERVGFSEVFQMLTDTIESSEEETVYFDCIMKQSLEKRSLSNIWENRSLDDIKKGLEESISTNVFSRREVLDRCLLPLIENPSDISSYVKQISVVQLSDVVIHRLEGADLRGFLNRILDSPCNISSVKLSKEVLSHVKSPSEIVGVFQECISAQNEEEQNEIMIEMFKFISGKLCVNTLLELHVGFLKRIPGLMESNQK